MEDVSEEPGIYAVFGVLLLAQSRDVAEVELEWAFEVGVDGGGTQGKALSARRAEVVTAEQGAHDVGIRLHVEAGRAGYARRCLKAKPSDWDVGLGKELPQES